jgi:hypothetical protein
MNSLLDCLVNKENHFCFASTSEYYQSVVGNPEITKFLCSLQRLYLPRHRTFRRWQSNYIVDFVRKSSKKQINTSHHYRFLVLFDSV